MSSYVREQQERMREKAKDGGREVGRTCQSGFRVVFGVFRVRNASAVAAYGVWQWPYGEFRAWCCGFPYKWPGQKGRARHPSRLGQPSRHGQPSTHVSYATHTYSDPQGLISNRWE